MSLTYSKMLPLGTKAIDFTLFNPIDKKNYSLKDCIGSKGILLMFICNHCPYVQHLHPQLVNVAHDCQEKGIGVLAISSNDTINYPEDSPENMVKISQQYGYKFPYLYDKTQEIARLYKAECTPEFYLFDENASLFYRGRFDASTPKNNLPVSGEDLLMAVKFLLEGIKLDDKLQKPSMGCNIKWKNL